MRTIDSARPSGMSSVSAEGGTLMKQPLVIIGAGGFGREVAWLVDEINQWQPTWEFLGFVDDFVSGHTVEGDPILGKTDDLAQMNPRPAVVCAIGDPVTRKKLVRRYAELGFSFATLVHPSVLRSRYVEIGEGSIICAGTVLTTNVSIGAHSILSPNCTNGARLDSRPFLKSHAGHQHSGRSPDRGRVLFRSQLVCNQQSVGG